MPSARSTRATRASTRRQAEPATDQGSSKRPRHSSQPNSPINPPRGKRTRHQVDVRPPDINVSISNPLPTPSSTQQPPQSSNFQSESYLDMDITELTLQNYHQAMKYWPLGRIQQQLARQRSANHQLSEAVIAEGQAVMEHMEHTIHMIAMVSGVSLSKLKRSLGLLGGTHAENPWHRWLSFAQEANKYPMPVRGDPNASEILTYRNQSNAKTYQGLDDDEYDVFTSKVFYALGGYPDYSAISVTEDSNVFGDSSTLVPEVPKLSPEDELRYRPIYERLVDQKKVARDRELNTPASSASKEEKRSLQCIKKIAHQLVRDHHVVGLYYYIIACSNNASGDGWCREYTTRDEMSQWLSAKAQFQHIFPLYCQNGSTFEEIKAIANNGNAPMPRAKVSNNQCNIDKKILTMKLNEMLLKVVGEAKYPSRGFPKVADPISALVERRIDVTIERDVDAHLSNEEFLKGFTGMPAKARRHWLLDIEEGKFRLISKVSSGPAIDPSL
ncbi:hypothetical protein DFH28DRAFT_888051 [Melampsora americana]|nr:hypothetical protein DFH28DRAFT_888051 [Melampsora americana]